LSRIAKNTGLQPSDLLVESEIGQRYHQFRSELMIVNNEGFTSTYNRFHDPVETSSDLLELRRLHGEMDQHQRDQDWRRKGERK
jgi:hypothetical protein